MAIGITADYLNTTAKNVTEKATTPNHLRVTTRPVRNDPPPVDIASVSGGTPQPLALHPEVPSFDTSVLGCEQLDSATPEALAAYLMPGATRDIAGQNDKFSPAYIRSTSKASHQEQKALAAA
ncbi:hypothetical protein ACFL5U_00175 [Candidatus Margulisiibacteriota bacterium]